MTPPILRISDQLLLHHALERSSPHSSNSALMSTIGNGLLDTCMQKAFQSKIPGCEEHQFKLQSVLQDANSNARSLTIAWIDLENAYGSVNHYRFNPYLVELVSNLYTNLTASVVTPSWSTAIFGMEIGVFQGDPLSVSIFNVVINTRRSLSSALPPPWLPFFLLQDISQPPAVCR